MPCAGPRRARPCPWPRSRGVTELAVLAQPAVLDRLEDVAVRHLTAVDVQRDRGRLAGVLQHVILERRDQRAGLADTGVDHRLLLELDDVVLGVAGEALVRRTLDLAAM